MINEAELRRIACRQGANPMLMDLDYALGITDTYAELDQALAVEAARKLG